MPMDFPDLKSLQMAAELWKFRPINEGESEDAYRSALADFVEPNDFVESQEIRNKVGWDRFTPDMAAGMVKRKFGQAGQFFR